MDKIGKRLISGGHKYVGGVVGWCRKNIGRRFSFMLYGRYMYTYVT